MIEVPTMPLIGDASDAARAVVRIHKALLDVDGALDALAGRVSALEHGPAPRKKPIRRGRVYVVLAMRGTHDDREEWYVAAYPTKREAKAHARRAEKAQRSIEEAADDAHCRYDVDAASDPDVWDTWVRWRDRLKRANPYDPTEHDYDAEYEVMPVAAGDVAPPKDLEVAIPAVPRRVQKTAASP